MREGRMDEGRMREEQRREMPPFVPLPPAIVDEWVPILTGSQLKLLLVVTRQTLGFADQKTGGRKAEDWLTHRQLMQRTGCASAAVSGAVDALVRAGLVRVRTEGGEEAGTPEKRRRAAGKLLYGLGPALVPAQVLEGERATTSTACPTTSSRLPSMTSESGVRKAKTTKERMYKRDLLVVFENRSRREPHGEGQGNQSQGSEESERQDPRPAGLGRGWVWRKREARWERTSGSPET